MYGLGKSSELGKVEVGLTPILEHYYVLRSRLFDNIVSNPNHELKALLPPDYDVVNNCDAVLINYLSIYQVRYAYRSGRKI